MIAPLLISLLILVGGHEGELLKPWFDGLKSKAGTSCCTNYDGHPPEAVWKTENGYKVEIGGQWVDVPPSAVIEGPNLYGGAVVWYWTEYIDDKPIYHVRCFLAGTLS